MMGKYFSILIIAISALLQLASCSKGKSDTRIYLEDCRTDIATKLDNKDYATAIADIGNLSKSYDLTKYPDIACDYTFLHARALQFEGKYADAVKLYRKCLDFNCNDDSIADHIRNTVIDAMLQMMNSYQSAGRPDICVTEFKKIIDKPTPIVSKYCMRDLYSIYGYALSRTDATVEAEAVMEKALAMPMYKPTHRRLFRDYAYATGVCFGDQAKQDSVIAWGKRAFAEAEQIQGKMSGAQWVTSTLGLVYKRTGEIVDAVDMYERSLNLAEKNGDNIGKANTYIAISDLYLYYNLPQQANEFAQKALECCSVSTDMNPMLKGGALIMKGRVMQNLNYPDSALSYFNKADKFCRDLPYNSGQVDIDVLLGGLLVDKGGKESVDQGIYRLNRVVAKAETDNNRARAFFQLAKAYDKKNQYAKCDIMLDSMSRLLNSSQKPLFINGANLYAIEFYLKKHPDNDKLRAYSRSLSDEVEKSYNNRSFKSVAEHMLKYGLEKKQHELDMAEAQLENKILEKKYYVTLVIALALLLIVAITWAVYRHRLENIRRIVAEKQIASLLDDLKGANMRGDKLEEMMKNMQNDHESWKQLSDITPATLREEGELKFRSNIDRLYPDFMKSLKEAAPSITRREEVLCMLILLGQNTEQIADIMCIAKSSVNIMRHRLRQKLELGKDMSLEDAVKKAAGIKA